MPRSAVICDTDINILSFDANERPRCRDGANNNAWIIVEEAELQVETFGDLSITDGLQISASIVLVWTVGYVGRMVIHTVMRTRNL